jgi:hypothetical protein
MSMHPPLSLMVQTGTIKFEQLEEHIIALHGHSLGELVRQTCHHTGAALLPVGRRMQESYVTRQWVAWPFARLGAGWRHGLVVRLPHRVRTITFAVADPAGRVRSPLA